MAGAYTAILEIIAPSSAAYGDRISVEAKIRNLADYPIYISASSKFDNTLLYLYPESATVAGGATYSFSGSFSMPNHDVRLYVWSYYWNGTAWYLDDESYIDIALKIPVAGKISRKELEHNGDRDIIPAYDIPQGERGLVHIWGRNDTSVTQRMGIWWQVKDPDGRSVEEHSEWEGWPYTSPGDDHEFIGGRFTMNKPGTYTIDVALYMNPEDEEIVDTYYGTLGIVSLVVPEPEFSGFGIIDYSKR